MTTHLPLVSVLIPCYNASAWVGQTLDSVLAQTYPRVEVIVVNDGSTDNSREVLARFESLGVRVIDQENRGQTAALNEALRHASGEFIQYLDADDLLAPDKIALQVDRLLHHRDCVASAAWSRFRESTNEAVFRHHETDTDLEPVEWLVRNWHEGAGMMYPALWLLPRQLVGAIGPWDERLSLLNDTDYFVRAVLASKSVLFCGDARTFYRSGIAGSLSGMRSLKGWLSQEVVLFLCQHRLLLREDSERTRRVISLLWQRFAQSSYPYAPALANGALIRASALSPVQLPPDGGRFYKYVTRLTGWKLARCLQVISGRP